MPADPAPAARPSSRRTKQLAKIKARRAELTKRREDMLDDVVSGCNYAFLAEKYKISLRTVRREVDRALDHRHLDRPDRYMRIQVDRLNHAIKAVDDAILHGDYHAVDALLKLVEKLDRYHGLARALAAVPDPTPLLPAPSAPLALTDTRVAKDHATL